MSSSLDLECFLPRAPQCGVEFGSEAFAAHSQGVAACAYDDSSAVGLVCQTLTHEMTKLPFDPVTPICAQNFTLGYDETDESHSGILVGSTVHNQGC